MKSRHHLEAIVIIPAPLPDVACNCRGVRKYREALLDSFFFHPSTVLCHLVVTLELLRWLLNDDALNNVKQLAIQLLL
jgi:hypothetical protein